MAIEPETKCIRKYHHEFGELLDRLTILQLKEVKHTQLKAQFSKEIEDIMHDVDVILTNSHKQLTAEFLRDLIILAEFNAHIWYLEDAARLGKAGDDLRVTHSINGIRREAINRIQRLLNGRIDKKVDSLANVFATEFKQWQPSGY